MTQQTASFAELTPDINAPNRSSDAGLAWRGIDVERVCYPGGEYSTPALPAHYIVLHVGGAPMLLVQRRCGHTEHSVILPEDVLIVPAGTPNVCWHSEPAELVFIRLEPFLIAEAAAATGIDPARVEIKNNFGERDSQIGAISLTLMDETISPGLGGHLYVESLTTQLIVHLLRRHAITPRLFSEPTGGLSPARLQRVLDFIGDQLERDLPLAEMAAAVHLSSYHFARQFKQAVGVSPHQYIIQQRVEAAKRLLARDDLTISQVAATVGFADHSHLTRYFKRLVGLSPAAYQRQITRS